MTHTLTEAAEPADTLAELQCDTRAVHWLARCATSGAMQLWQWPAHSGAAPRCLISDGVGSRVNQYGGGSYAPLLGGVAWVRQHDQALLYQSAQGDTALWQRRPHTAYGGLCADPTRQRVLAVEEDACGQRLVAISRTGRTLLAEGEDFYGAPAISQSGNALAWVCWSLPHMPWQRSRLRLASLTASGELGQPTEWDFGAAIGQPQFGPNDALICMSDHAGWWQPWRVDLATPVCLSRAPFDHITTPWALGERQHAWSLDRHVYCQLHQGAMQLYRHANGETHAVLPAPGRVIGLALAEHGDYAIVQSPDAGAQLLRMERDRVIRCVAGNQPPLVTRSAQWLEAPVGNAGETAHGFFYPALLASSKSLIVRIHGGPTAATYPVYDPLVAYWQELGFHVLDVNPRGSANFGRRYRECLQGQWGLSDREDVIALVSALRQRQPLDPACCFIRGQSAGGLTALNTLATTELFAAATSLYGVTDARRLAAQTHRFESGYLAWLMGDEQTMDSRSPLQRIARCTRPLRVLFVQGGQDAVVVPEQTLRLKTHIEAHGGHAECLLFAHERHGIRSPQARQAMLARELDRYRTHAHAARLLGTKVVAP